jgi:hypothetical protein
VALPEGRCDAGDPLGGLQMDPELPPGEARGLAFVLAVGVSGERDVLAICS